MKFVVEPPDERKRLDVFVSEKTPKLSRSSIKKLIDSGQVTVNGAPVKSGHRLNPGDDVVLDYDISRIGKAPAIKLPVIYEDDDCLVINKPAGVLTHSRGTFSSEPTVASFIQDKLTGLDGERAGIVHRLDRATSGVIICAKHPRALSWLQKQFSQRKARKLYRAVIEGAISPERAIIDMPIERNPKDPKTFRAGHSGKTASTEYKTLKRSKKYSLLSLEPKTGRTHQLRIHLSQVNRPILGDTMYGGAKADRLYLHALALRITLPSGKESEFKTKLPTEFEDTLQS